MAVRYLQSGDEAGFLEVGGQIANDDDGGWVGLERAFAGIALAVSLTASAFAAQAALKLQQDCEDVPAGSLASFNAPEEDRWQPPVPPIAQASPRAFADTEELPTPPAFGPDEDYALTLIVRRERWIISQWGSPVGTSYIPPTIVPEEDFWQSPVAPVPPAVYQRLPYLPDLSDDPAGSLAKFSNPDEDYWGNLVSPLPPTLSQPLPIAGTQAEDIPPVTFQPQEEYWGNPIFPAPLVISQRLPYLPDLADDPAGSLFGQPDEDFSSGIALPTFCRAEAAPRPYLPDLGDDPAGSLAKFSSPEEDFWASPVARFAPSLYQPLPIAPAEPDFTPAVVFLPEEDLWQNSVAPVPPRVGGGLALPWGPQGVPLQDLGDDPAGSLHGVPEETEWQNPVPAGTGQNRVAPLAASVFPSLPYSFDAAEILLPPAFTPEEDCWPPLAVATGGWQNPVMPGQAARTWTQPAVCGFDEFSSYWWTSRWAVRTHSAARGRVSHSVARERISRSGARPRTSRGISRQSVISS